MRIVVYMLVDDAEKKKNNGEILPRDCIRKFSYLETFWFRGNP
jgi:hypothetical protein